MDWCNQVSKARKSLAVASTWDACRLLLYLEARVWEAQGAFSWAGLPRSLGEQRAGPCDVMCLPAHHHPARSQALVACGFKREAGRKERGRASEAQMGLFACGSDIHKGGATSQMNP